MALGEVPGCGELSGVGVGRNFGRNAFKRGSNFLASSAEENSIANNTLGSFGRVGQLATIIREVVNASDSELSHFIQQEQAEWLPAKNEFRGFEIVR